MDSAARIRWAVLFFLLALTIVAVLSPVDEAEAPRRPRIAKSPAAAKILLPTSTVSSAANSTTTSFTDPFAARGWQAPPPPAVTAAPKKVIVVPAVAPGPVGPPPLPFQFMGRLSDEGVQTVYLSRGQKTIVAARGEKLEGIYEVMEIGPRQIDFKYLPTGEKQTLHLPVSD